MHAPLSKAKKRPLLSPSFVRAMLAGHSALGLAFAALIYIVCITGALAVFVHELGRWEQPDGPVVAQTPSAEIIAAALRAGYAKAVAAGSAHDIHIVGPLQTPGRLIVHYHDHEKGIEGEWLADRTGALVAPVATPWTRFIGDLHMHLHLPRTWGKYLVGLTGVALFASLISGLLSHPRIFKDAFSLRWGGSRRLQEADLHNRLGVWGLPFHVVVTVSGALLGLSSLIIGVLAVAAYDGDRAKALSILFGAAPVENKTAAPVPDLAVMIRHVQASQPDAEFARAFVQHAGTAGQEVQLGMSRSGHVAFSENHRFDAGGHPIAGAVEGEGGVGRWILNALQPLHFGWFAGMPGKILYGVLGLALTIVTHTGVTIWLARRRDKGNPAAHWEKAWVVVGWSQPLAFATTAVVALTIPGAALLHFYLGSLFLCAVWGAMVRGADALARQLRFATAASLLAAAAVHACCWGGIPTSEMALAVDLAIVATAAILLLPLLWSSETMASTSEEFVSSRQTQRHIA